MNPISFLSDMCYPYEIPEPIKHGRWTMWQRDTPDVLKRLAEERGMPVKDRQTLLSVLNYAGLHLEHGEIVMDDSPHELKRHLEFMRTAKGRVLKTGLGLGCVVRGLLTKPDVEHIDVVEIEPWIAEVIGREFENNPKVSVHVADAHVWDYGDSKWDYIWHDIHNNDESGPELSVQHASLMKRFMGDAGKQGAWAFPREAKRRINRGPRPLIG